MDEFMFTSSGLGHSALSPPGPSPTISRFVPARLLTKLHSPNWSLRAQALLELESLLPDTPRSSLVSSSSESMVEVLLDELFFVLIDDSELRLAYRSFALLGNMVRRTARIDERTGRDVLWGQERVFGKLIHKIFDKWGDRRLVIRRASCSLLAALIEHVVGLEVVVLRLVSALGGGGGNGSSSISSNSSSSSSSSSPWWHVKEQMINFVVYCLLKDRSISSSSSSSSLPFEKVVGVLLETLKDIRLRVKFVSVEALAVVRKSMGIDRLLPLLEDLRMTNRKQYDLLLKRFELPHVPVMHPKMPGVIEHKILKSARERQLQQKQRRKLAATMSMGVGGPTASLNRLRRHRAHSAPKRFGSSPASPSSSFGSMNAGRRRNVVGFDDEDEEEEEEGEEEDPENESESESESDGESGIEDDVEDRDGIKGRGGRRRPREDRRHRHHQHHDDDDIEVRGEDRQRRREQQHHNRRHLSQQQQQHHNRHLPRRRPLDDDEDTVDVHDQDDDDGIVVPARSRPSPASSPPSSGVVSGASAPSSSSTTSNVDRFDELEREHARENEMERRRKQTLGQWRRLRATGTTAASQHHHQHHHHHHHQGSGGGAPPSMGLSQTNRLFVHRRRGGISQFRFNAGGGRTTDLSQTTGGVISRSPTDSSSSSVVSPVSSPSGSSLFRHRVRARKARYSWKTNTSTATSSSSSSSSPSSSASASAAATAAVAVTAHRHRSGKVLDKNSSVVSGYSRSAVASGASVVRPSSQDDRIVPASSSITRSRSPLNAEESGDESDSEEEEARDDVLSILRNKRRKVRRERKKLFGVSSSRDHSSSTGGSDSLVPTTGGGGGGGGSQTDRSERLSTLRGLRRGQSSRDRKRRRMRASFDASGVASDPSSGSQDLHHRPPPSPSPSVPASYRYDEDSVSRLSPASQTLPWKDLKPCDEPEKEYSSALQGLSSDNWLLQFHGVTSIRRLVRFHTDVLTRGRSVRSVTGMVNKCVLNLRSQLARSAVLCIQELFQSFKRRLDRELKKVIPTLLKRSSLHNHFITADAEATLSCLVVNTTVEKTITILLPFVGDKTPAVRVLTGRLLNEAIVFLQGLDKLRRFPEMRSLLSAVLLLMKDRNTDCRKWGQVSGFRISGEFDSSPRPNDSFERFLRRHLRTDREVKEFLDGVRRGRQKELGSSSSSDGMRRRLATSPPKLGMTRNHRRRRMLGGTVRLGSSGGGGGGVSSAGGGRRTTAGGVSHRRSRSRSCAPSPSSATGGVNARESLGFGAPPPSPTTSTISCPPDRDRGQSPLHAATVPTWKRRLNRRALLFRGAMGGTSRKRTLNRRHLRKKRRQGLGFELVPTNAGGIGGGVGVLGKTTRGTRRRGGRTPYDPKNGTIHFREGLKTISPLLTSDEFRKRLQGLGELEELLAESANMSQHDHLRATRLLVPSLTDSNRKVKELSYRILNRGLLTKLSGGSIQMVLEKLLEAVAQAFSSPIYVVRNGSHSAFNAICEKVDAIHVVRQFPHLMRTSNVKKRVRLLEKIQILVEEAHENRPSSIERFVLPTCSRIVKNESNIEVKNSAFQLLRKVFSIMGDEMFCVHFFSLQDQAKIRRKDLM